MLIIHTINPWLKCFCCTVIVAHALSTFLLILSIIHMAIQQQINNKQRYIWLKLLLYYIKMFTMKSFSLSFWLLRHVFYLHLNSFQLIRWLLLFTIQLQYRHRWDNSSLVSLHIAHILCIFKSLLSYLIVASCF